MLIVKAEDYQKKLKSLEQDNPKAQNSSLIGDQEIRLILYCIGVGELGANP
jgi:hypothetical protein